MGLIARITLTEDEIEMLQNEYRMLWDRCINKKLPSNVRREYRYRREGFVTSLFALRLCDQVGTPDIDLEYTLKEIEERKGE